MSELEVQVVVPLDGVDWLEDEIEAFADPEVEDDRRSRVYYVTEKSFEELADFLERMLAKHATTGEYVVEVKPGKVFLRRTTAQPWFVSSGALPPEGALPTRGCATHPRVRYPPAPHCIEPVRGDLWVAAVFPRMPEMGERPSRQRAAEEAKSRDTAVLTEAVSGWTSSHPQGTASIDL